MAIATPDRSTQGALSAALQSATDIRMVGTAASSQAMNALVIERVPDVAVVDLRLTDALAGCCSLVHDAPAAALIVVAPDGDPEAFEALSYGATSCLPVEQAAGELADTVRASARGEAILPPIIAGRLLQALAAVPGESGLMGTQALTSTEQEVLTRLAGGDAPAIIATRYQVTARLVNLHAGYAVAKLQRHIERTKDESAAISDPGSELLAPDDPEAGPDVVDGADLVVDQSEG